MVKCIHYAPDAPHQVSRGALERGDRLGVVGWAHDGAAATRLTVAATGRVPFTVVADRYRADLAAAGEGGGDCAFEAWFDPPLADDAPAEIHVRLPNGDALAGSPMRLSATRGLPGMWHADLGAPLALVVDEAAPDPARDAGSVALLSHMAALRHLGFQVLFTTLAEAADTLARTAGRVRVAYLHRLRPMALLAGPVRAANPGAHVLFAVADLAHVRPEHAAAVLGGVAPPGLLGAELAAARAADAVVTHSAAEAALLARVLPKSRVHVVPWAVSLRPVAVAFTERAGIGFLGSYGHAPNQDAARVLLDAVMPQVWRHAPVPCVLAGSGAPDWLRRRDGGLVRVLGQVADTQELWRGVRVSAAPLRFGAGVKGKVLDSLAAGIPCACLPIAAEGLAVPETLRADDVPALAALLLHLHADAAANAAAAAAGFAMVAACHSADAVVEALRAALPQPLLDQPVATRAPSTRAMPSGACQ